MNGMFRFLSNFKEFYNDINGATLTGAIDVVVVEQPNGSFNCSPFHVRFGKLGVLRSKEKVVDIEINGEPLNIHMKLGESGEAFFVEELEDSEETDIPEHLATSPIPVAVLEKIFKSQGRRRSFNLDDIDLNQPNLYEKRRYTADSQMANSRAHLELDFLKRQIGLGNIEGASLEDVTYSLTASRRSDEEDLSHSQNDDVSETIFKMDSLEESVSSKAEKVELASIHIIKEKTPPLKVSPEESQVGESKTNKKKKKKMRKKNASRKSASSHTFHSSNNVENVERASESTTDRSSMDSNCSEADLKDLQVKSEKISKESADQQQPPIETETSNLKKVDADFHFFSDTELTTGNGESRSVSPVNVESVQSDSEIEIKLRSKDADNDEPAKSWEWGEFPSVSQTTSPTDDPGNEEKKSMLSSMFSFMKSKHNVQSRIDGGIYLSEITSGVVDRDVAEIYFSKKSNQTAEDIDLLDCESGNGPSLTQSPNSPVGCKSIDSDFDEQTKLVQSYCQDVALSLCGWDANLTEEQFNENLVSFTDFCNNSSILENSKLVAKINNKYYSWKVAIPILVSIMSFGRPLLQSSLDHLCNTYMVVPESKDTNAQQESKNQPNRLSWWHWRSRSSRESTPQAQEPGSSSLKKSEAEKLEDKDYVDGTTDGKVSHGKSIEETKGVLENMPKREDLHIGIRPESPKLLSDKCRKTLRLSSKQIASLNLRDGMNEVEFSVTTAYQGTTRCQCHLYKWKWDDKIVISDIDGTITKSDVLGHILPIVGKDWAQSGVAQLFNKIKDNGYKLLYLSARAIGQARITREYLRSIKQGDMNMPDGPILLNPTSLITAFHREVIEKKPEAFKISCMSDIKALFPTDSEPFYAGYGNRINDVWAYRAVGIPIHRIFTINPKGELKHELTQTFQSSYSNMSIIVDQMFPSRLEPANDYSQFTYWREPLTDVKELSEK